MQFSAKLFAATGVALIAASALISQQNAPPAKPIPPPATAPVTATTTAEFLRTTDEVLAEMSKLLGMPIKEPLKKSLRSRDEIRAYVLREMNEDETAEERYADQKEMEKLGLIPKIFRSIPSWWICSPNKSPDSTIQKPKSFTSPIGSRRKISAK